MPDSKEHAKEHYKRVNILITHEQYQQVTQSDLKLSGLVRGLLEDHFSDGKITFSVSEDIKLAYDTAVSNLGAEDKHLEPYFIDALDAYLAKKSEEISTIREAIKTSTHPSRSDSR